MTESFGRLGLAGKFFAASRAVNYEVVASRGRAGGFDLVFDDRFARFVRKLFGLYRFTRDLFAANGTVFDEVVAAAIFAGRRNFVFLFSFACGVTESFGLVGNVAVAARAGVGRETARRTGRRSHGSRVSVLVRKFFRSGSFLARRRARRTFVGRDFAKFVSAPIVVVTRNQPRKKASRGDKIKDHR